MSDNSEIEVPCKKHTSEFILSDFALTMPKRNQTNIILNISYKDRRILIVDDEPYNLMALKVVIDAADTRVKDMIDEATNGLEAYEAVKKAD